ncbi:MAG: ROK family protein, partial [Aestuariivirga sp.]|uniref:ROK family protein n=1 Tax=Aestuariivirga sp. TaxID=2650926 RepID=UPI00301791ED
PGALGRSGAVGLPSTAMPPTSVCAAGTFLAAASALAFAESAADDIALGLVAVIHVLSPQRVVIGGGVANAFDVLAPIIRPLVDARLMPPFRGVEIARSMLGDDAGLVGAAQLILRPLQD